MLNNEHTWVNLFVNMTLFRQSFVPAVASTQVLGAHPAVQQPALAFQPSLQANIQGDQNVHVVSPPSSVQALSPQAHGQYMQAPVQPTGLRLTPQQLNQNLFQEAVLQHAASTAAQQVQPGPASQTPLQQSHFQALHSLSSSDASTTSGSSSSSSGDSASSVSGSNVPFRPMYQSMGPHLNIPFDV